MSFCVWSFLLEDNQSIRKESENRGKIKESRSALFSASMIISSWSMTLVHADTITNIALNKKVTTSYACSGFGAEKQWMVISHHAGQLNLVNMS